MKQWLLMTKQLDAPNSLASISKHSTHMTMEFALQTNELSQIFTTYFDVLFLLVCNIIPSSGEATNLGIFATLQLYI